MGDLRRDRLGRDDAGLESLLRAAGSKVAFPPTPEIWPAVAADLRPVAEPSTPRRPRQRPTWPGARLLVAATLILALIAVSLLAFPELRTVVAQRLGLSGLIIRFIDEPPAAPTAPLGSALDLGRAVSLSEAARASRFTLRLPTVADLGQPSAVYVTYGETNRMVSAVYPASDLLPASRFTGVGALLTQFEGTAEMPLIAKGLRSESAVRATTVNGAPAFWIDGAAHFFMYEAPSGELLAEDYRLAGNVLLWEIDGVTYRLESELPETAAVAIAESMQPVESGTD